MPRYLWPDTPHPCRLRLRWQRSQRSLVPRTYLYWTPDDHGLCAMSFERPAPGRLIGAGPTHFVAVAAPEVSHSSTLLRVEAEFDALAIDPSC